MSAEDLMNTTDQRAMQPACTPIDDYRARLAQGAEAHWRSGCPCCDSAHPCAQVTATLSLLEFIA
jgi:hypothetical protein